MTIADIQRVDRPDRPVADGTTGITVGTVGFSERTRERMRHLFSRQVGPMRLVDDADSADVVLVNFDDAATRRSRLAAAVGDPVERTDTSHRPAVVGVGADGRDVEVAVRVDAWVVRPIVPADLVACLRSFLPVADRGGESARAGHAHRESPSARHGAAGPTRHRDVARGATRAAAGRVRARVAMGRMPEVEAVRARSTCVLDLLHEAIARNDRTHRPVVLLERSGSILIGADGGGAVTTLDDRQFHRLIRWSSPGDWTLRGVGRHGDPVVGRPVDTEQLLWAAGAWTYGADPPTDAWTGPLRLRRWPNLSRNLALVGDAALSACWTTRSMTVDEITATLRLDRDDVLRFVSAAWAAGLFLSAPDTATDAPATPEAPRGTARRRSFLVSLLGRIRG